MSDSARPFELNVAVCSDDDSVLELLVEQCELSRTQLKQAMARGALWLRRGRTINGAKRRRIRRANQSLKEGDELTLYYSAKIINESVPTPVLLSDEQDYSVWIKPRGVHSQGTRYGDHCAMVRLVEKEFLASAEKLERGGGSRSVMLVHRLDRYANGLMVLAHNKKTAAALSALFRQRAVIKRYTALVHGCVSSEQRGRVIGFDIDGKAARTTIQCVNAEERGGANGGANCSLLEVQIDTGRKHQVRRHLAQIGHAIVGDRQYALRDGGKNENEIVLDGMDLQLSASLLEFLCPISQQRKCYTLPDSYLAEMRQVLQATQTAQTK